MSKQQCYDCGRLVKIKPILGSLHLCLSPELRPSNRRAELAMKAQLDFMATHNPKSESESRHE